MIKLMKINQLTLSNRMSRNNLMLNKFKMIKSTKMNFKILSLRNYSYYKVISKLSNNRLSLYKFKNNNLIQNQLNLKVVILMKIISKMKTQHF